MFLRLVAGREIARGRCRRSGSGRRAAAPGPACPGRCGSQGACSTGIRSGRRRCTSSRKAIELVTLLVPPLLAVRRAHQRDHVARILVEVEPGVGVVAAPALDLVAAALVAHVVHDLAGAVLGAADAHVQAHAPVGQARVVLAPALHREALDQAHAPAALRGGEGALQCAARGGVERKVVLLQRQQRLVQRAGVRQRGVEAGHLGRRSGAGSSRCRCGPGRRSRRGGRRRGLGWGLMLCECLREGRQCGWGASQNKSDSSFTSFIRKFDEARVPSPPSTPCCAAAPWPPPQPRRT